MAVDEFGREILGGGGGSAWGGSSGKNDQDDEESKLLHHALPTGRKRKQQQQQQAPPRRSPPPPPPPPPPKAAPHASTKYAAEPMLCEYLYKEQEQQEGGEETEDKPKQDYLEYRKTYCLNYVRMFFNTHLDDFWFRREYSPLEAQRAKLQEQQRAQAEAQAMLSSVNVEDARLGGGVVPRSMPQTVQERLETALPTSPKGGPKKVIKNQVPPAHALLTAKDEASSSFLWIAHIPPECTDAHVLQGLLQQCTQHKAKDVQASMSIMSSSVVQGRSNNYSYERCALVQGPPAVLQDIWQQVQRTPAANIPRKQHGASPETTTTTIAQVVVDCTDPYGRTQVDADGRGGVDTPPAVRTAVLSVSQTLPSAPAVVVLGAPMSSPERHAQDLAQATEMAQLLDVQAGLTSSSWSALAEKIKDCTVQDQLDVCIAYLRRVHSCCYYNGGQTTPYFCDMLTGHHAASTVYLRLAPEPVDEFASTKKEEPEEEEMDISQDLLVQAHQAAITKRLESLRQWNQEFGNKSPRVIQTPELDAIAADLEQAESQVEPKWIANHSVIDQDGRARCTFHFCKKLFKDESFLTKHLLKKHSEYLHAERATCHDQAMMKVWDAQEVRPVPPILVDCGHVFSTRPSPVIGAAVPLAQDPEPELWRKQEERRRQEEELAEARRREYEQQQQQQQYNNNGGPGNQVPRPRNFVDVDDMKEEKVEMSFDDVEIPTEPPKKKRKKKKLL